MFERNLPPDIGQSQTRRRVLGRRIQNIPQTRHRNPHLLEILPQLRQTDHGRRHLSREHIERNQLPHRQLALNHQPCANPQRRHRHQLLNQLHPLLADHCQLRYPKSRSHISRQLVVPTLRHLRLHRHRLYRTHRSDAFHQKRLVVCIARELIV